MWRNLESKTSIRRVLLATSCISLAFSVSQGALEFVSPDESFHVHTKDYDLFGHGGMMFWFISSIIFASVSFVNLKRTNPFQIELFLLGLRRRDFVTLVQIEGEVGVTDQSVVLLLRRYPVRFERIAIGRQRIVALPRHRMRIVHRRRYHFALLRPPDAIRLLHFPLRLFQVFDEIIMKNYSFIHSWTFIHLVWHSRFFSFPTNLKWTIVERKRASLYRTSTRFLRWKPIRTTSTRYFGDCVNWLIPKSYNFRSIFDPGQWFLR